MLLEIVKVKCVGVIKILFYNFTPSGLLGMLDSSLMGGG